MLAAELGFKIDDKHIRPAKETGEHFHTLELQADGERVGQAEMVYFSDPLPFYYVANVVVDPAFRGYGFGSILVEQINNFLDKKKKVGILYNAIQKNTPQNAVYEKHGWVESASSGLMSYNPINKQVGETMLEKIATKLDGWSRKSFN